MSIESDSDRLDIIRTLAGITQDEIEVTYAGGSFVAIYDEPTDDAQFDDIAVEQTAPTLSCVRTIDVANLVKDTMLDVPTMEGIQRFRFLRHEPDGTGMSRVILVL